jgi:hypothetical protein
MAAPTQGQGTYNQTYDSNLNLNVTLGTGTPGTTVGNPIFTTAAASGTVTANQGTAAVPANKWPIEIVDSGGVNIAAVTAANAVKVDGSGATQPVSIAANVGVTQQTSPWVSNINQFGGTNVSTGTGASGAGIPRVTVSNDSAIVQGTAAATAGAWPAKVTDGTTVAGVIAGTTRMIINYPNAASAPATPLVLNFNPPLPQAVAANNWTVTNSVATATNITAVFVKNI